MNARAICPRPVHNALTCNCIRARAQLAQHTQLQGRIAHDQPGEGAGADLRRFRSSCGAHVSSTCACMHWQLRRTSIPGTAARSPCRNYSAAQHSAADMLLYDAARCTAPRSAPARPSYQSSGWPRRSGGLFCVWCVDGKHDAVGCDGLRCPGLRARAARCGGERTGRPGRPRWPRGRPRPDRRLHRPARLGPCHGGPPRIRTQNTPPAPPQPARALVARAGRGGAGGTGGQIHVRHRTCVEQRARDPTETFDCTVRSTVQPQPIRTQRHAGSLRATFAVGRRASRRWAMECGERGRHAQQTSCAAAAVAPSASDAEDLRTTIRCLPQCWCVVCTRVGCTAGGLGVHSWRQTCSAGGLEPHSIPSSGQHLPHRRHKPGSWVCRGSAETALGTVTGRARWAHV